MMMMYRLEMCVLFGGVEEKKRANQAITKITKKN